MSPRLAFRAVSARGEARISVGYVRRAHGIRGEVIVRPLTDHPERYRIGARLETDEAPVRIMTVAGVRSHNDGLLVRFEGIDDRTSAEALQGVTLTIGAADRRELTNGEYWPDDLEGMVVIDPQGRHLGVVAGVVLAEAQDRLVVTTPSGGEVEVPFVDEIVGEIHPSLGHVVVDPPDGLF
jgi:16S rRNA processing protein RimM